MTAKPFIALALGICLLPACTGETGGPTADAPTVTPSLTVAERMELPPDIANGQSLFKECAICHNVDNNASHRIGPNLGGIVGAPAARHADFAYSQALRRADIVWDESTLDGFIKQPQTALPGNRMAYPGNRNPADRRDIIAYLETTSE